MYSWIVFTAATLALATPFPEGRSVDVTSFSVRGIKLYMTSGEVLTRVKANQAQDGPSAGWSGSYVPCVRDKAKALTSRTSISGGRCLELLTYRSSAYSLSIDFIEDYPARPGVSIAYRLVYRPVVQTTADSTSFQNAVLAKYGQPSWRDKWSDTHFGYCHTEPHNQFGNIRNECVLGTPEMTVDAQILLIHFSYGMSRKQAADRYLQSLQTNSVPL